MMDSVEGKPDVRLPSDDLGDDEWFNWVQELQPVEDIDEASVATNRPESEHARLFMLYGALGTFGLTVLVSFAIIIWCSSATWDRTSDLLSSIIPVETLVIGAAVTYYFKTEQN